MLGLFSWAVDAKDTKQKIKLQTTEDVLFMTSVDG
jgi:hypothetical protein